MKTTTGNNAKFKTITVLGFVLFLYNVR